MYNTIDYQNALWGKNLYTEDGLKVRAEILKEYCPKIEEETTKLFQLINDVERVPLEDILNMNQRVFSRWVNSIFECIHQATTLAKEYLSYEKIDLPIEKLGDRDILRTALMGAYQNQTDIDFYDTIDNIIFVITDLNLGFNPTESCFSVIAKYMVTNIKKYKQFSITEVLNMVRENSSEYIIDFNEDNKDNVFLDILSKIDSNK